MELLRRALLVGCILPGLWMLRLAPLDPLLSVTPVDFAALQKQEAASVPDDRKTEAERRRALLPLSVYVEETLQYNVFSAAGSEWDRFLSALDDEGRRRRTGGATVFVRADENPIRDVLDKVAAGGGSTYVSFSRPGGDRHYRVDRHAWTRQDFRPFAGFTGTPAPPAQMLYSFRVLGIGSVLAGLGLFVLLPGSRRAGAGTGPTGYEIVALGAGLFCFVIPLIAVGGSVQALTRGLWLTLPSWIVTILGVHVFAAPGRNAPGPLSAAASDAARLDRGGGPARVLFVREGLVFLAMAFGPLVFLIAASITLWNR